VGITIYPFGTQANYGSHPEKTDDFGREIPSSSPSEDGDHGDLARFGLNQHICGVIHPVNKKLLTQL